MKVMKRNGTDVIFDITKIIAAITKVNNTLCVDDRLHHVKIHRIVESVKLSSQKLYRSPSVEVFHDVVGSKSRASGA